MNVKLIADAGSTKTEWALIKDGESPLRFKTDGINALLATDEYIENILDEARSKISDHVAPEEIFFYGAGCVSKEICDKMASRLKSKLGNVTASAASDLLGAARALLQKKRGIACILGSGSNSCLYNGFGIEVNVPSLGYVLGDEGSGAALGKRLVADTFKGIMPEGIKQKFLDSLKLTLPDILNKIYKEPAPNKFLASLVPFLKDNLWNPYIYSLVLKEFSEFTERNLIRYPGVHSLPICFTGSVALHFRQVLEEALSKSGLTLGDVGGAPMDGLIEYHSN